MWHVEVGRIDRRKRFDHILLQIGGCRYGRAELSPHRFGDAAGAVLPSRMARIIAVAPALPDHVYAQADITAMIGPLVTQDRTRQAILERLHASSKVDTRHLVMPLERYADPQTFTQSNDLFIEVALDLAERSLAAALDSAGLDASDIDYIIFTSVTGISAPSIDALLISRMGLRDDVKRVPIYGLGCVAGAAGIARVDDYLAGHPDAIAALVAVELCSLTFQRDDSSMANLVATGLFGDGAASVVMAGERRAIALGAHASGLDIISTRSRVYPETEAVIGFNAGETGFRIVLTPEVTSVIETYFAADVDAFLAPLGLTVSDIDHFVAHAGGPKILEAFASSLGLSDTAFEISWRSLAEVGNLSSVSVLHTLSRSISEHAHHAGELTLLFALGPGVSVELVLLRAAS